MEPTPRAGAAAAYNCPNCGAAAAPDAVACSYCGSSIAVRICGSCFGPVAVSMRHCPHCGAAVADPDAVDARRALSCPVCATALVRAAAGARSFHECLRCGGLWIGKDDFRDICLQQQEQEAVLRFRTGGGPGTPAPVGRRRAYIPCPECGRLMNRQSFCRGSGIVLDWCRDHGSWFDRGELGRTVAFIRRGGLRQSRERERRQLEQETARLRMRQVRPLTSPAPPAGAGDSLLRFIGKMFSG